VGRKEEERRRKERQGGRGRWEVGGGENL